MADTCCYAICSPVCQAVGNCSGYVASSGQMLTPGAYSTVAGWINTYRNRFFYSSIGTSVSGKAYASHWNALASGVNGATYYTWNGSSLNGPYGTSQPGASSSTKITDTPASKIGSDINNRYCGKVTTRYCYNVCVCEYACGCEGNEPCGCVGYNPCGCDGYCV